MGKVFVYLVFGVFEDILYCKTYIVPVWNVPFILWKYILWDYWNPVLSKKHSDSFLSCDYHEFFWMDM